MLNEQDLNKIQKIVHTESRKTAREEIRTELEPIKSDLADLRSDLGSDLADLKGDVGTMKSDITKIRTDISTIVSFFDHEFIGLRRRIERIEEVLSLPPLTEVST